MFNHHINGAARPQFGGRVAPRLSGSSNLSSRSAARFDPPATGLRWLLGWILSGWLLAALLGVAGCLFSPAADAAAMGNILPGAMVHKSVQSMREMNYSHLVEQQYDYSCGAAAVATILRYGFGMENITEKQVLKGLFKVADPQVVKKRGFSLLDIKHYVQRIGLAGRGYKVSVKGLRRIRVPTIVLLNLDGYYHFVVLREVEGRRVFIADPALGNRTMRLDAFLDAWQNQVVFAVIGPGYDEQNALMQTRGPLSARQLYNIYAPVPSVESVGFGVSNATLF